MPRVWRYALAITAATLVLPAAPAGAAPGWTDPPLVVGRPGQGGGVAMAPDGTITQVTDTDSDDAIEVLTKPPGQPFGSPTTIIEASNPVLVDGAGGTVGLVYRHTGNLWATVRLPGGSFTTATKLGPGTLVAATLDASGQLWGLYDTADSGDGLIPFVRDPAGTLKTFPALTMTGTYAPLTGAGIGLMPDGGVHLVFGQKSYFLNGATCTVDSRVAGVDISAAKVAGTAQTLASAHANGQTVGSICGATDSSVVSYGGALATSPAGQTLTTISTFTVSPLGTALTSRIRPAGAAWADAPTDAVAAASVGGPGVFAQETPVVAYTSATGPGLSAHGSNWSTPTFSAGSSPRLAAAPDGTIVMAFDNANKISGLVRSPAGVVSAPVVLSATGAHFDGIAMDDRDNAVVGWHRTDAAVDKFEVSGYDASGPALTITGPDAGVAGTPLGFDAVAADVWSTASLPTWLFGDGGTGDGAHVDHTFTTTGPFTLTASATDGRGLTTSTTKDVTIAPVPTPTPTTTGVPTATPTATPTAAPPVKPAITKFTVKVAKRKAKLSFTVSELVTVRVTIKRKGAKKAGTISKALPAGKATIKTKKLKPGRYTFTLVATNGDDVASDPAVITKRVTTASPPRRRRAHGS